MLTALRGTLRRMKPRSKKQRIADDLISQVRELCQEAPLEVLEHVLSKDPVILGGSQQAWMWILIHAGKDLPLTPEREEVIAQACLGEWYTLDPTGLQDTSRWSTARWISHGFPLLSGISMGKHPSGIPSLLVRRVEQITHRTGSAIATGPLSTTLEMFLKHGWLPTRDEQVALLQDIDASLIEHLPNFQLLPEVRTGCYATPLGNRLLEEYLQKMGVEEDVWQALLPTWNGSVNDLVEACRLV